MHHCDLLFVRPGGGVQVAGFRQENERSFRRISQEQGNGFGEEIDTETSADFAALLAKDIYRCANLDFTLGSWLLQFQERQQRAGHVAGIPACGMPSKVSDFVNYNKRSVTLPFGCKDLAELLALKSSSSDTTLKHEKLTAIAEHISRAWNSSSERFVLWISPGKIDDASQGEKLCFTLQRLHGDDLEANVQVRMGSHEEAGFRLFLERHGYALPDTSVPKQFNPNWPVAILWTVSPFPSKPDEFTALVIALLRQVCRLKDDSEVTVSFHEFTARH